MKEIRSIVHARVKKTEEDFYYKSAAAMFDDPRLGPLMGMAYKTFRKHKYASTEPFENQYVIVKRGVVLGKDKEEGPAE